MITIKLDKNALERALQDDTTGEMRLDIQNAIIQKFADTHLKPLINSEHFKRIATTIQDELQAELSRQYGQFKTTGSSWKSTQTLQLNAETKAIIARETTDILNKYLYDIQKDMFTKIDDAIKNVNARMDRELFKLKSELAIQEGFDSHLNALIRNQLKSILGGGQ